MGAAEVRCPVTVEGGCAVVVAAVGPRGRLQPPRQEGQQLRLRITSGERHGHANLTL